jgi:hypothetical protein
MKDISTNVCIILINGFIIAIFSYAVFWQHHSGWWFLVAAFLLHSDKPNKESEQDEK